VRRHGARGASAGVDFFVEQPYTGCRWQDPNDFSSDPPPQGVHALSDDFSAGAAAVDGGWYLPDEPDAIPLTAAELPQLPPASATGKLRVLTVSQHFYSGQALIRPGYDRGEYARLAARADLVGFDMYPIVKFCGRVPLTDMFHAQRELMTTYAPGKPTFQWIETSKMTGECSTIAITPAIVKAETWLAVAGGACGIGYFTNSWTGDVWNRWDFDPGVEAALPAIVEGVQQLAPALCDGTYGDVVTPWNGTVVASSRELNGALYVIAVNGSDRPTTVPFRVDALRGRTLTVLDESRTIRPVKTVYFRDSFAPYGVHVYMAAP
jgi:hypothetical protein